MVSDWKAVKQKLGPRLVPNRHESGSVLTAAETEAVCVPLAFIVRIDAAPFLFEI